MESRRLAGAFVVLWLAMQPGAFPQQRPAALEHFQRARETLKTGTVEYFYRVAGAGPPAGVYRTARIAGPDLIDVVRGVPKESEGQRSATGAVPYPSPIPTLKRGKEVWTLLTEQQSLIYSDNERAVGNAVDIRTLGAISALSYSDIQDTLWRDPGALPGARAYEERVEDDLHVVVAKTDNGELTWWIDPERDWNPVRVTAVQEGKTVAETRISLRNFDGVWFPDTVLRFRGAFREGAEPAEVIRVMSAIFNDPNQPARFTPADIGVEIGMTIERPGEGKGTPLLFYDGRAAVSERDYREKVRSGEIQPGPNLVRKWNENRLNALERLVHNVALSKQHESEWAEYVRKFILKYQLDAEQTEKAIVILHECEDRALKYVQTKKARFGRA